MEKIPCIKCNSQLWEYIKPYLEKWGYIISGIVDWTAFPILVLNFDGIFGECSNVEKVNASAKNRELVTDVEKFLEEAAKLKGYTYKRNNMKKFTKADLKSGMVVETARKKKALVVNNMIIYNTSFDNLENYKEDLTNRIIPELDIIKVYEQSDFWGRGLSNGIEHGELLWERGELVEVTMQEIADKFGVPIEQLRIKE